MKIAREAKVGILVVIAFSLLAWGVNFLKGRDLFYTGIKYYGIYNRVDGLTEASPIFYKGYKIGVVRTIDIHPTNNQKFLITFSLTKDIPFSSSTVAQIYSLDLMGSKGVQFIPGNDNAKLQPGDTLRTSLMGDLMDQVSMEVLPLKDKAERLIVKLDSVLTNIGGFFGDRTQRSFHQSIIDFAQTMDNVKVISDRMKDQVQEGGNVNNTLVRLDSISAALNSKRGDLVSMIDNLSAFSGELRSAELTQTLADLSATLSETKTLLGSVNNGEGSMGLLLNDKVLYNNMTDVTRSLDRLLMDVRHRPERYVKFSALDLGRKVYVRETGYGTDGVVFQVLLVESSTPLDIAGKELEAGLKIYEDYNGKKYLYTVGEARSYDEMKVLKDKLVAEYPEATVIAFEDGNAIRVRKAIRKSEDKNL
jgi:phospholipid/cholesterol/gamma-HCH transport system substrate-binding protein